MVNLIITNIKDTKVFTSKVENAIHLKVKHED